MENLDIEVYENPTWYVLPQSQERVYLAHGDQVDDNNKAYIKWRQTIRGTAFRSVVRNCPEKIAHKVLLPIGEKLSHQSRALNRLANLEAYKQMFREFAFKRMSEGARAVFLGHSHVFDSYEQSEPAATSSFYINLGSWLEPTKRYAIWDLTANKNAEVFNL